MRNYLSSKTPESITRLAFFMIVVCVLIWETYAVVTKTTVPNLIEILAFAGATLGWKQYTEGKQPNGVVTTPQ